MIASGETPRILLLDAGPVIALFDAKDADHAVAHRGFRALARFRARLLVPLPIAFEVYKWLQYNVGSDAARLALRRMRQTIRIEYLGTDDFERISDIVNSMPTWNGSLEDAILAHSASRQQVPVWTFNYRDPRAFNDLEFWTPG